MSSSSFMRAQTPSPKSVPLGTTTAARARLAACGALELAHDELEEEERGLGGLLVGGEVVEDAALLLAAEGRVGEDDIHTVVVADFGDLHCESVAVFDVRVFQPVQEQIHLHEHVGQRLRLLSEQCFLLKNTAVGDGFAGGREVVVGLDKEAAGATGGVEHGLPELRLGDIHHELHDRARGVELAAISRRVTHLAQHVFVKAAKSVHLFAGSEVDAADFVDDVAKEVAGFHAIR